MSEINLHESIARWLRFVPAGQYAQYTLDKHTASDLLDEWEDAQAMIRALNVLVEQLQQDAPAQPPAWTVIA